MHADAQRLTLRRQRFDDVRDRKTRRVRRQYRVALDDRVEFAEHALLQFELLRHRLDDEIAVAQFFERQRVADAFDGGDGEIEAELAAFHGTFEAPFSIDDLGARLVENLLCQIADGDAIAGEREHLRDAAAHHAAADDTDALHRIQFHVRSPLRMVVAASIAATPCARAKRFGYDRDRFRNRGMTMQETSRATMLDLLGRQRADYLKHGEVDAATRIDRLDRAIALLVDHQQRLVDALSADFGHRSRHQSLFTDIAASIGPLKHAKKHLADWMKPEKRKVDFPMNLLGAKARIEYQPLGVVGVISPWNFPVNLTFTPLAGILAAGNRCMIKPSEYTPATSQADGRTRSRPRSTNSKSRWWSAVRRPAPISPACRSIICCSPAPRRWPVT